VIAVVLAGGRVVATAALRERVAGADVVIAADGGARHARTLGLRLDLIVGDMDSIDAGTLRRHADADVQRHPRDKDLLDLELALDEAATRGATTMIVVGVFGGRLDHELAALAVAQARHRSGYEVELHSGDALALPVRADQERSFEGVAGATVSVLATLPGTRVTLSGMRFGLVDGPLEPGIGLGLSNETTGGRASVRVHAGDALVVVPELRDVDPAGVIWGRHEARIDAGLRRIDPVLGDLVRRVAYDEVFADRALDLRTRELLALGHLIGLGAVEELRTHLHGALNAGATPEELRALLAHAAMFVGFPRALMAAKALRDVLDGPP
jgi:thiamine pyrophosphokinase